MSNEAGDREPSSETFMIENEDHTLANALRFFLNKKCDLKSITPLLSVWTTPALTDVGALQSPRGLLRLQHTSPGRACCQYPRADHRFAPVLAGRQRVAAVISGGVSCFDWYFPESLKAGGAAAAVD